MCWCNLNIAAAPWDPEANFWIEPSKSAVSSSKRASTSSPEDCLVEDSRWSASSMANWTAVFASLPPRSMLYEAPHLIGVPGQGWQAPEGAQ
eukprot:6215635-Amphidinium_carterae.1